MLLLTRKPGDQIVIDGRIVVKVIDIQGGRVQLGIEAPKDVKIEASAAESPARDKGERKP
jgi:carbon storage regulator